MKKKILALTLVAAMAASLAGCGSKAAAGTSGTSGASGSPSQPKSVKIALVADNKPYTYAETDGKPAGYDYEVLQKIDDLLPNYSFEYQVIDFETGLIGTKEGKYDINAGCYFRTDAREKAYLVSAPYNYYFLNLIVRPDSNINTMNDLNGKSVVPINATDGRYASFTDWVKAHPDVKISMNPTTSQDTYVDMCDAVHNGTYDAAYLSKPQFDGVAGKLPYQLKVTGNVDGRDTVYLINKEETDLQTQINQAIDKLKTDGTLSKLSQQYFQQDNFAIAKQLGLVK